MSDNTEGPTGCLGDGDDLSLALRKISPERLDEILREELDIHHCPHCHSLMELQRVCEQCGEREAAEG